jgi:hypothetical protein
VAIESLIRSATETAMKAFRGSMSHLQHAMRHATFRQRGWVEFNRIERHATGAANICQCKTVGSPVIRSSAPSLPATSKGDFAAAQRLRPSIHRPSNQGTFVAAVHVTSALSFLARELDW